MCLPNNACRDGIYPVSIAQRDDHAYRDAMNGVFTLRLDDLPGLDAGGADQDPPDSALEDDFDALEVGEHAA